jgi:ribose transport system ATP-binding protein
MVGSGRTELVRLIFGASQNKTGEILIEGKRVNIRAPHQAISAGFSLLTEDRQKTGLILDHSIEWNVSLVHLSNTAGGWIDERKDKEKTRQLVDLINIKTPNIHQEVRFLSGGNQQKVVLAKWLYADANVIIFDEPTRGIDIGAKEEIYKFMVGLAKQGKYIIMISSDMPELIAMCDRVYVMRQGRIVREISQAEINEENILTYSIGGTL